jgi:hypothetical protein
MVVLRLIGWLMVAVALGLLAREAYYWLTTGLWEILPAGQLWFNLHRNSLLLVQPAIERYLWTGLWNGVETILTWPAWLVIGVPGLLLALLRFRRRRADPKRRYFKSR